MVQNINSINLDYSSIFNYNIFNIYDYYMIGFNKYYIFINIYLT